MTLLSDSSQLDQNPALDAHVGHIDVGSTGKTKFVIQLRTLREPRKDSTMSLFVASVATKPVTSLLMLFSNSVRVLVSADSTRAQFPWGQVTFVLGELLLLRQ